MACVVLKLLGIALAIWIVLSVLGAVFKFLGTALVLGALVFVGRRGLLGGQGPVPAVDPALTGLSRCRAVPRTAVQVRLT